MTAIRRMTALIGAVACLLGSGSIAKEASNTITTQGNPSEFVRRVLTPLFERAPHADRDETATFAFEFKTLVDKYFSIQDNARSFDADWLLGAQDWSESTPSYSAFVIDDTHAIVKVEVRYNGAPEDKVSTFTNIYNVVYREGGWRIDDIMYDDRITLRQIIAHGSWCKLRTRNSTNYDSCNMDSWR
jgi:hypothetical protein